MRKVILSLSVSLEQYIARPWGDSRLPRHAQGLLDGSFSATVDTAIMGRKSFGRGF